MALTLNEEQQLLSDSAKDFFSKSMPVSLLRELRDNDNELGYSESHWKEMIELGWGGIVVPEAFGGLDFGYQGLGVVLEEAGRTLAASPLFTTCVLGGASLALAGSEQQKSELLPLIVSGELLFALAIEESATHGPKRTKTSAIKIDKGYRITGDKTFVLDGHIANKLVVVTRTSGEAGSEEGLTLFLVDRDSSGIEITQRKMVDSRNASDISFRDVEVSSSEMLGTLDQGYSVLDNVLSIAQICYASEMLGSMQEAFERTVEYIKTRVQFDVPLGSFQVLQHRAAKMYVEIDLCKSIVIAALSALDDDANANELGQHASLVKAKVTETFNLVSSEAIQMHGGIGMTDEEEIGFFLKRARVAEHTLGDIRYHQNRYGDLIGI
ncbi:MAG: acyl-CoA/acyl-ACP dehydrogenase [Pseudomonadales bacterium]|nr:acyl-CoA/acyl-ACP dehydrogenase [Pseudomonadales bacterium]